MYITIFYKQTKLGNMLKLDHNQEKLSLKQKSQPINFKNDTEQKIVWPGIFFIVRPLKDHKKPYDITQAM